MLVVEMLAYLVVYVESLCSDSDHTYTHTDATPVASQCACCSPGFKVASHCSWSAPTVCVPCGNESYMNACTSSKNCYICHTHCAHDELIKCAGTTDRVCGKYGSVRPHCACDNCASCNVQMATANAKTVIANVENRSKNKKILFVCDNRTNKICAF
ncbi:unknown [Singapore grouper iridovirus]|uniref:TNFR-Cys domain-containing protein n=1 Tax=Singapore grouper iridovirus TaxID=262968 RepID=Q5YFG9_9VIRU|nr:hypothetical protein ORF096R [Singapore grouper iridovirus]AAS18111.1 unknown [Singapore grouper iridovirus]WAU86805.1 hypothetical protein ORF096R [Singapore grouper iridovirus]